MRVPASNRAPACLRAVGVHLLSAVSGGVSAARVRRAPHQTRLVCATIVKAHARVCAQLQAPMLERDLVSRQNLGAGIEEPFTGQTSPGRRREGGVPWTSECSTTIAAWSGRRTCSGTRSVGGERAVGGRPDRGRRSNDSVQNGLSWGLQGRLRENIRHVVGNTRTLTRA